MFCANCGNELPEGARFCGDCGVKIEPVQPAYAASAEPAPVRPAPPPPAQAAPSYQQAYAPAIYSPAGQPGRAVSVGQ